MISSLVKKFNLQHFTQHTDGAVLLEQSKNIPVQRRVLPEGASMRSDRLVGGIGSLVNAMAADLPQDTVELNTRVTAIRMDEGGTVTLETILSGGHKQDRHASAVILALPPRIAANHITFSPQLPDELIASLTAKPTWMAEQAKAVAIYDRPFWREDGLSGQAMSWAGPLQEIHDASPADTGYGALFGFFGMSASSRQKLGEENVHASVVYQLTHLFGPDAKNPLALLYKDWARDPDTAVEADTEPLSEFPSYGPPANAGTWDRRLVFAGTETASDYGGHLEGALQSAERAVSDVLQSD